MVLSTKTAQQPDIEQVQHLRVPLDLLIPNPSNYNQHPPEQIRDLKSSLRRFGQVKDSVTRKSANGYMLIAGHGITQAARELLEESPEQFAHLKEWNIVLVPSHWTDLDARAYMVSDNETAKKSEPDESLLLQLLQEQANAGYDLASLGSDDEALRDMLAKMTPPTLDQLTELYGDEPEEQAFWPVIRVKVSPETKELYDSLMEDAQGTDESIKFAWLLERVHVAGVPDPTDYEDKAFAEAELARV